MGETGPEPELTHDVQPGQPKKRLFGGILPDVSLSRFQTIVGLTAGLISIAGALYPFIGPPKPAPVSTGEVVTIVQDARSTKPVPDATIEVLTLKDALVTTLTPKDQGRARQALKEGSYKLRVSHSRFGTAVREIQVIAGQTAEVRVQLVQTASRPSSPAPTPVSTGEVVTIVQDARSAKPVPDATIEVLTLKDALVTILTPKDRGRARQTLKEGSYKLRVSHSRFRTAVREIRVIAGHTAEVRVRLVQRAGFPASLVKDATHAINEGVEALKHTFR